MISGRIKTGCCRRCFPEHNTKREIDDGEYLFLLCCPCPPPREAFYKAHSCHHFHNLSNARASLGFSHVSTEILLQKRKKATPPPPKKPQLHLFEKLNCYGTVHKYSDAILSDVCISVRQVCTVLWCVVVALPAR